MTDVATPAWSWPEELDALIAAPDYHTLLFENDHIRVMETHIPPDHTVPLHTHRWPCATYVVSWSDIIRRDGNGNILLDSRTGGGLTEKTAVWTEAFPPHTVENVGGGELRTLNVELKTR